MQTTHQFFPLLLFSFDLIECSTASSANIELGGIQSGLVIDHVVSMNPRGWSCMHIGEGEVATGSKACTNATITNNSIGPCGLEGRDDAGRGRWADGISFGCSSSLIQGNTVRTRISILSLWQESLMVT